MIDVKLQRLNEVAPYDGPHAIPGIRFRAVASALGISAWGMNVLELDPGCERYPQHDHEQDGQEEVYLVLDGRVTLHAGDESFELERGTFARVGPGQTRKLVTTDAGATILAIGATPGRAYERK